MTGGASTSIRTASAAAAPCVQTLVILVILPSQPHPRAVIFTSGGVNKGGGQGGGGGRG